MLLENTIAVVSGGGRGIGGAIARGYANASYLNVN